MCITRKRPAVVWMHKLIPYAMLTLYVRTGCPYCKKVLDVLHEDTELSYDVRNIADPKNLEKLMEYGGQQQTPFLHGEEEGINMYESASIIDALHARFGIEE